MLLDNQCQDKKKSKGFVVPLFHKRTNQPEDPSESLAPWPHAQQPQQYEEPSFPTAHKISTWVTATVGHLHCSECSLSLWSPQEVLEPPRYVLLQQRQQVPYLQSVQISGEHQ